MIIIIVIIVIIIIIIIVIVIIIIITIIIIIIITVTIIFIIIIIIVDVVVVNCSKANWIAYLVILSLKYDPYFPKNEKVIFMSIFMIEGCYKFVIWSYYHGQLMYTTPHPHGVSIWLP